MGRVKDLVSDEEWEAWDRDRPDEPYMPQDKLYFVVKTLAGYGDFSSACIVSADDADGRGARRVLNDLYAGKHPEFFSSVDVWIGSEIEIIALV